MTYRRKVVIAILFCVLVAWTAGENGRFLVVLLLCLFGPGYLLETFLSPCAQTERTVPFVRPALWLAGSLSLIALFYAWTTAAGLSLSTPLLAVLALLCGLATLWTTWRHPATPTNPAATTTSQPVSGNTALIFLLVFALTLWTRVLQIEELVLPAWVDPVHHTLMIRAAIEQGEVPYSLHPYLPVDNLPYHWGYHVFTATITRLSGLSIPQVMLWEGQLLNALHVLTCAALASYLWRSARAGIVAGVVVGVISIMPSYYVSWGRYTHLTGLLLLPPLAISWHRLLHTPARNTILWSALLLAGLCLVHVLVLLLALILLAVITLIWAVYTRKPLLLAAPLRNAVFAATLSLLLVAPWIRVIVSRILLPSNEHPQSGLVTAGDFPLLHEGLFWAGQNHLLVALALLATLWGFWRRAKPAILMVGWGMLLAMAANPWMISYLFPAIGTPLILWSWQQRKYSGVIIGSLLFMVNPMVVELPYIWLITNDILSISMFIILAVLIGGGYHMLLTRLERIRHSQWRMLACYGSMVVVGIWALWGAWGLRHVINDETILVKAPDRPALQWIAENTPPDARFLINAAPWYAVAARGSDAGYWIMPLTGRWTSTPPTLFIHGPPEYVQHMQTISNQVVNFEQGQEDQLDALIAAENITHIFLGANGGPLPRTHFELDPRYEPVYDHEGVTIFAVRTDPLK